MNPRGDPANNGPTSSILTARQRKALRCVDQAPGNASAVSGALYFTANAAQQMGAPAQDVAAYTIAAGAVTGAASGLSALSQSAVSVVKNPYVLLGAADAALLYGVVNEGIAAWQEPIR